jgi:molybdopterin adenylyltransferase
MRDTEDFRAALVTVSDTRIADNDRSGRMLSECVWRSNGKVVEQSIVTDDLESIKSELHRLCSRGDIDVVLTTGGTGFADRDNTPEATRAVIDREAPGLAEAIRRETSRHTPMAMLSRGVAGLCKRTLVVNLPGSPKAVEECFEVIAPVLKHAAALLRGDTRH